MSADRRRSTKCPCDPRIKYNRTYALSTYLNGYEWPGWTWFHAVRSLQAIRKPASMMSFAEDKDDRGYVEGSFTAPYNNAWGDMPATYHPTGMVVSFADGHGMFYNYVDPLTPLVSTFNMPAPNNLDVLFFFNAWYPDPP